MKDIFGVTIRDLDIVSIASGNRQNLAMVQSISPRGELVVWFFADNLASLSDQLFHIKHSQHRAIVIDFRFVPVDALLTRKAMIDAKG